MSCGDHNNEESSGEDPRIVQSLCDPPIYNTIGCCCCPPATTHTALWPNPAIRLANENLLVLNVIQFLCGVGAIVLSGVAISNRVFLNELATGMWSGVVMLVTGIHGIITARRKSLCTLIALLVLCVLAGLTSAILSCVSVAGLVKDNLSDEPHKVPAIVLHALLLVVGSLEACIAITTAVLSSRQICLFVVTATDHDGSGGHTYVSEVLLRNVARRGPLPVSTSSGGHARASVLFVVPSRTSEEPMLLFPPFPPAYSPEEPRPLLPPSGPDAFFRPALVLAEDPPPYSTVERRPVSTGVGGRVQLRSGRRITSAPPPLSRLASESTGDPLV